MTYLGIVDVVNAEYKACKEYEPKLMCKDCLYFTEREPKEWQDIADIGLCDRITRDNIAVEIRKDCPANHWCDNQFKPKDDGWESVSK
jgi:uncharacterized CHY-type Zn-finger protein